MYLGHMLLRILLWRNKNHKRKDLQIHLVREVLFTIKKADLLQGSPSIYRKLPINSLGPFANIKRQPDFTQQLRNASSLKANKQKREFRKDNAGGIRKYFKTIINCPGFERNDVPMKKDKTYFFRTTREQILVIKTSIVEMN
jgi:hypothetical protein